ncbi:MAG: SprT-like domain-containing protein [Bacteroidetes bacterium]|nr:SprT-like domain-containing protein [Bacteroidota bacterium]
MAFEQYHAKVEKALQNFVPARTANSLAGLVVRNQVILKIKRPRRTKLGDYRPHQNGVQHIITINNNLNQYAFLITLVHEIAHLYQFRTYGRKAKPHGEEWQSYFRQLMQPYLAQKVFPTEIQDALLKHMNNIKASSCVDHNLQEALKKYDVNQPKGVVTVAELAPLQTFEWGAKGRIFRIEGKMRTRYKCIELHTGRAFAFSAMAQVKPVRL